jgi:hypothetical protein
VSTLLQISDEMRTLDNLVAEIAAEGGDISQVEDTITAWFNEIGEKRDQKVDNYCALVREFELRAKARDEEVQRLQKRVETDLNAAGFLKARLKSFFEEQGIKKIETERYTVSIAKNGGQQPIEYTCDPDQMFDSDHTKCVETWKWDTEKVRADLEAGKELPFAKFKERGTRLSIR